MRKQSPRSRSVTISRQRQGRMTLIRSRPWIVPGISSIALDAKKSPIFEISHTIGCPHRRFRIRPRSLRSALQSCLVSLLACSFGKADSSEKIPNLQDSMHRIIEGAFLPRPRKLKSLFNTPQAVISEPRNTPLASISLTGSLAPTTSFLEKNKPRRCGACLEPIDSH